MYCNKESAAGLMLVSVLFGNCCPVFGSKIWTGAPLFNVVWEKLPERSGCVGTVENASYGELPRTPVHPAKKKFFLLPS